MTDIRETARQAATERALAGEFTVDDIADVVAVAVLREARERVRYQSRLFEPNEAAYTALVQLLDEFAVLLREVDPPAGTPYQHVTLPPNTAETHVAPTRREPEPSDAEVDAFVADIYQERVSPEAPPLTTDVRQRIEQAGYRRGITMSSHAAGHRAAAREALIILQEQITVTVDELNADIQLTTLQPYDAVRVCWRRGELSMARFILSKVTALQSSLSTPETPK